MEEQKIIEVRNSCLMHAIEAKMSPNTKDCDDVKNKTIIELAKEFEQYLRKG